MLVQLVDWTTFAVPESVSSEESVAGPIQREETKAAEGKWNMGMETGRRETWRRNIGHSSSSAGQKGFDFALCATPQG
jgi:hypothetical protein